jgi:hypothetical protein
MNTGINILLLIVLLSSTMIYAKNYNPYNRDYDYDSDLVITETTQPVGVGSSTEFVRQVRRVPRYSRYWNSDSDFYWYETQNKIFMHINNLLENLTPNMILVGAAVIFLFYYTSGTSTTVQPTGQP